MSVTSLATIPPLVLDVADVVSCKCCGGGAMRCGGADFARSCQDAFGPPPFAPSGIVVPYHRCGGCGFVFTVSFDSLTPDEFSAHVYNTEYALADPDFAGARSRHNAQWLASLLPDARGRRLLDYGGGNGGLATLMRAAGFSNARSYDPFFPSAGGRPAARFELVTAFEVVEHSTTPEATFRDMRWFMEDDALLVFSTLLRPADLADDPMQWWYAAPRNGHVSLHCKGSLDALMDRLGLRWGSFNEATHVAFRKRVPRFAAHLLGGVAAR